MRSNAPPGDTLAILRMVDLHHHLLPGLDDGSPNLETSVAMARIAAEDGITHVVATPHANNVYTFDPERIATRIAALRSALASEAIPLTISSGCDFHLSYDNIQDAIAHPRKYTLNKGDYLLVELPDYGLSPHLDEAFYELGLAGMRPVLTHPERNPTLQRDSTRLADWMRTGMLIQITTSSVVGQMGRTAERMAHKLLADRWVHFLATDAHNTESRPPRMRAAHDLVAKKYGIEYADRLCITNPMTAFEGRPLAEQEEPLHLYKDDPELTRRWWQIFWRQKKSDQDDD
jgi:protein-tyrosine phosphatase